MAKIFRLPLDSMKARLMVPLLGLVMALIFMLQCWVMHAMTQYYHSEAGRDLAVNASMFNATEEIHRRNIQSRFELIAKEPRLKALLQNKDSSNQRLYLSDLLVQESVRTAVLRDTRGHVLAEATLPGTTQWQGSESEDITCSHADLASQTRVHTTLVDGTLIDCVTTPVAINGTIEARLTPTH